MRSLRLNPTEKRLLANFQKEDAQRADLALAQLKAGEISREDFRWLIGEDQSSEDRGPAMRPRDFKYRDKFSGWLDARPV